MVWKPLTGPIYLFEYIRARVVYCGWLLGSKRLSISLAMATAEGDQRGSLRWERDGQNRRARSESENMAERRHRQTRYIIP